MQATAQINELPGISPLSASVLRILAYFDIFNYPLSAREIFEYCDHKDISFIELGVELSQLLASGYINEHREFYFLQNDPGLVEKRLEANIISEKYLEKASRFSSIMAHFPFVRGICISGSLSKKNADHKADIDYFILTQPGRLWIARTLLVLFKKLFLLNSRKFFCVNYFVDTDHLEIPDRNIFTATEIVFLIPTYNLDNYRLFLEANAWTSRHYPNAHARDAGNLISDKDFYIKRFTERLMSGRFGEALDTFFFRLTLARWKKKFSNFTESEFDLKMRSRKHVSKHHPGGFQGKVLLAYGEKIAGLQQRLGIYIEK
jgi:hypothetical protein